MSSLNHNKNHAELIQAVHALRHQLIQPDTRVFDIFASQPDTVGLQKALQTFSLHADWHQLDQALQRIESVVRLLSCPILGVAGLLNSGKSSFVASYLSEAGRQRVLRGDTSNCGTQRFVFWLPQQWRQDETLWADMLTEIGQLFTGEYEMLSDDPAQAHRQYNQIKATEQRLDVPLIATDPALHDLALLDCPDVQRGDDAMPATKREAFLRQAAPICSAFLFVTTQKNIADEKARNVASLLRQMMPDVPLHLIMNQVEADNHYPPHQFLRDQYIRQLINLCHVTHFYIAYHYKITGWQEQTPPALHYLVSTGHPTNQVPAAWQVLPDAVDNAIEHIQPERFLINLPSQLQASDLSSPQILSHWHRFKLCKRQAISNLLHQVQQEQQTTRQLHQQLLDFCHQHTVDDANNPRLPLSAELVKKLHHGMEAAAPAYIRPLLLSGRKMQQMVSSSIDGLKKILAKVRIIDKSALYSLKSQALNAQHLSETMRQSALQAYVADASQDELQQTWNRIIRKTEITAAKLADQLDDAQIARSAADAWNNIPLMKKVTAIGQGMLALLASLSVVLLIPFGSPAAAVLAQASLPELIAAAGLGGLSGWGFASTTLARNLEQELFIPYFSDFFHLACDAFALPRKVSAQVVGIQLHNEQYALKETTLPREQPAAWCKPPRFWQQHTPGFARLDQHIQDIDQAISEQMK